MSRYNNAVSQSGAYEMFYKEIVTKTGGMESAIWEM